MLSVEPIKAFTDNYIWLVSTNEGSIVIDPGESKSIQKLIDNKTSTVKISSLPIIIVRDNIHLAPLSNKK